MAEHGPPCYPLTMRALLLAAALLPLPALANGGPVAWNTPSGRGDLAPTTVGEVRLISERLRIALDAQGDGYTVAAEYLVRNESGKPVKVKYGVPLDWIPAQRPDGGWSGIDAAKAARGAAATRYPASVEIRLAGERRPCALEGVEPAQDEGSQVERFEGWCVVDLVIPPGEPVALSLHYPGALRFEDWAYSKSPFIVFSKRTLRYRLSPAAGWKGPPDSVDIEVELSAWADDVERATPAGSVREGTALRWHLAQPDLKALSTLEVVVDGTRAREFRDRLRRDRWVTRLEASASSTLPPQGAFRYDAANLVDGDAGTAWCAGKRPGKDGTWVEVRAEAKDLPEFCTLNGFVLVPGFARDQATYERNNRVTSYRLGPCGEAASGFRFIGPPRRAREAFVDLEAPGELDEALRKTRSICVRLQILEVEEGPDRDTCLSEFRPVINCG